MLRSLLSQFDIDQCHFNRDDQKKKRVEIRARHSRSFQEDNCDLFCAIRSIGFGNDPTPVMVSPIQLHPPAQSVFLLPDVFQDPAGAANTGSIEHPSEPFLRYSSAYENQRGNHGYIKPLHERKSTERWAFSFSNVTLILGIMDRRMIRNLQRANPGFR